MPVEEPTDALDSRPDFRALRRELGVPEEFPPDVLAAAERAAAAPHLPNRDARDLELVTLDPIGSRDLDQAFGISRDGDGWLVSYAIADVAAFVEPGDPVDVEAHRRGVTLYSADLRTPLHPPALSEGAASLLPGVDRPAVLWSLRLDPDGVPLDVDVRRCVVRSRAQLDYESVQRDLEAGTAPDPLPLLREIGLLRLRAERDRGAVSLAVPEQEVEVGPRGVRLGFRVPLPVEAWNAQLSLLTGMTAARLMLDGRVGLLRTLASPEPAALAALRRSAAALGVPWPAAASYAEAMRGLDPAEPTHAALLQLATRTTRGGAGYVAFDGAVPEQGGHSAVAAPYAHCTAPLRRLADRYVSEVCLALCAGTPVPEWARRALPGLPDTMRETDARARQLDRAEVDLVEALLLRGRVGEVFDAVVVEVRESGGVVQLRDPAVRARCRGPRLPLGESLRVRLAIADPGARTVEFVPAG